MTVDTRLDEEKLGSFEGLRSLARLFRFADGLRALLWLCILGSLMASGIQVALPLLIRQAVDAVMSGSSLAFMQSLAWQYAGYLLLYLGLAWATTLGLNAIGQQVVRRVRLSIFEHLHTLPIRYFDHNPVGRLTTRVANDTDALSEVFASVIASVVGDVILLTGAAASMLVLDFRVALWIGLIFPLLWGVTHWFRRESQRIYRDIRVLLARINAFFQESVSGLGIIKSFAAEARMAGRFEALNLEYYGAEKSLVGALAIFRPMVGTAATLGTGLVLWQGGLLVLHGQMSLGTLAAFLSYVKMLFSPIDELAEKLNLFQQALIASERIFRILDTPSEPSGAETVAPVRGHIEFRHVTFAYDPDKPVLQDVSFEVQPGETVALVGPTGSGKTTLAALLLGLYPIEGHGSGAIHIDGVPIERWDVRALRRSIGLVQQDLFLFRNDLRHNVSLFTDVTDAQVARALEASQASRVVEQYADGLQHAVNERGSSLSQGERQLLSFARALVQDPPILLLDEATASVDSLTEKAIQTALHRILHGRTAIVVAHRLSTIQEADRILVLKKGCIVEQGTHSELLARDGLYAHLFRTQSLTVTSS